MTALVHLDDFSLVQGRQRILDAVSVTIHPGEKVALVGPSGAGKSSLLKEIYRRLGDAAALCPQQLGLVDALSAYHNIYMARLEQRGFWLNLWNLFFPLPQARREVRSIADSLGVGELLERPVVSLSGGERQRVALARGCYRGKAIFVGDEPVSSLDPEQGQQVLALLCGSHETVVVALHNPKLALQNFDRVIGLRGGRLVFDQPASALTPDYLADFYRDG